MSRALDRGQQPIAPSALASGTANNTTFLRGDSTWQTVPTPTIASTAEAQAGTNNTNFMTPLRTAEQRDATALGWGQTWQDVFATRSAGVTYTNTTGRPIFVTLGQTSFSQRQLTVNGLVVSRQQTDVYTCSAIVPPGGTYSVNAGVTFWFELR